MEAPKIFSPDFYMQLLYSAIWKADSTISLHQRMDFTPKDRKTGSQKVKQNFVKKVRYCIIFSKKKQGLCPIQKHYMNDL